MTREDLLNNLIDNILFHDINIEKNSNKLVKGNGITTYCNYGSAEQLKKIRTIFILCFQIDNPNYEQYFPPDKFRLNKEAIIKNALLYFKNNGIDFDKQIRAVCDDAHEFETILLKAIVDYIIPAAFKISSIEDQPNKFNKIDKYFEDALRRIKIDLAQYHSLHLFRTSVPSLEFIDSNWKHKELCNYKILFSITELHLKCHYVPKWEADFIEIPQKLDKRKQSFEMFLDKQEKKSPFERLVEGFIPLSDDNMPSFQLDDISFGSDTDPIKYPLSDEITYYCNFFLPEYEYCTFLNPDIIQKDYPQVKDHASLKAAIAEQATKDISDYYKNRIKEKYREIAQYISFVISCLMRFDLSELINLNPTNMENCKIALSAFHIDPDEVFSVISEYKTDQTAMLLQAS